MSKVMQTQELTELLATLELTEGAPGDAAIRDPVPVG